ncbi:MAG: phospholipase D family protein, partial [Vallitaleaceae bacterium]|nr:phospholipase D family protein [Vallitaleaceae bacterium]
MKVLNNLKENHFTHILNILEKMDELLIVSPFLMDDFEEFLYEAKVMGIKKVTLITTLKDNTSDLLHKADSLYSFSVKCLEHNIQAVIKIDNSLHGKIYITSSNGIPFKGIITSANFTNAGLNRNHEWGVLLDESSELIEVIKDVNNVSSNPLSKKALEAIVSDIDRYIKVHGENKEPKIKLSVRKYINGDTEKKKGRKKYFFKPLGSSDEPFTIDRKLSEDKQVIHFSKRRPRAVGVGDILICYAVGVDTKLLGYFEVISEPKLIEVEGERWPWQVEVKNLDPEYSNNWGIRNITINDTIESYPTDLPLTAVGRRSIGTLQWGSDKLE